MRRILLVHNYYQLPGGEDTVVANEKKLLEETGNQVVLYTRNNNEIKQFKGIEKAFFPFVTFFNLKTYTDIRRLIDSEQIDIVHVHNTLSLVSPAVYYAAVSKKVPVVQTVHNFRLICPGATFFRDGHICEDCLENGLGCALRHKCYRNSFSQTLACVINTRLHRRTGIYKKINYICLSQFNKNKLLQSGIVDSNRVFVKPNYVDNVDTSFEKNNSFVYVGRLEETKGILELLDAWKIMGKDAPALRICGTGPLEENCNRIIKENSLNSVQMLGQVQHNQLYKVVGESKAIVMPTKWYEGLPMVLVEAFSLGTPAIVPNMGNAGEMVIDGVNGYKYEAGSIDALVGAVKRAISADDLSEKTIEQYRKFYTKEQNIDILNSIYECI